jgi:hypothetical protein
MSDADFPESLLPRLRTAQILATALILGLVAFVVIILFLRTANPKPPPPLPIITYVAVFFVAICLMASVFVPNLILANFRKQIARGKQPSTSAAWPPPPEDAALWLNLYQTALIIGLALLEGSAYFQLIAYQLESQPISLGVAGGLLLCMMLRFPTRAGVWRWIENQRELVEREKQDRGT